MKYHYGSPEDFDDVAGIVGRTKDLQRLTRSTVPLLAWWPENAQENLAPGVDLSHAKAHFEYAVSSSCTTCKSKGKASMTDVMVLLDNAAIAVEGKYTEPRYDTVGVWRNKGKNTENRENVLAHWCDLIEKYTETKVDPARLDGLVYQMLHRTASACAAAKGRGGAEVVYLVFGKPPMSSKYAADLTAAADILDPTKKIRFNLLYIPTFRGNDYSEIERLVGRATNDEERSELISEALISKRKLYQFGEPQRADLAALSHSR